MVSNKHLRIYTVIFDEGNPGEVAPLVYAHDLSTNGTQWNGVPMKRGNGGYLLSDGDTLTLTKHVTFSFESSQKQQDIQFPPNQLEEIKVSSPFPLNKETR